MNTTVAGQTDVQSDASLVELSLAGDREAFGQIVGRYQSPICALAYSACGNVARSEDVAQEVFITAWHKLGSLQERSRFKAWLYGIARNLIHNAFRQNARNRIAGADTLDGAMETARSEDEPDEQAISKEEETILWHVLSGMPVMYREPMVLFYREHESIARVAEVLGISEEAARQRLSRGRTLLNERVTKVVQSGLRRTGPADTFTLSVIAALPMFTAATTAKGAVVGIATTKSGAVPTTGLLGLLKGIAAFAGLIAVPATLGTYFGYKLRQDSGGGLQQQRSAAKFWRIFGWGIVLFLFLPLLLTFGVTGFLKSEARATFLSVMTFWLGLAYPFVLASLVFWAWQRRRTQSDTAPLPAAAPGEPIAMEMHGAIDPARRRWISRRTVLFLTIAAAALLVFCYSDMRHNVGHLSSKQLDELIERSSPAELRVSMTVSHYRSIWGESAEVYRSFCVETKKDGKKITYLAPVQDSAVALLAQKGIPCPTYIQGRDFEVLGTPGRFLPFLGAFVLGLGAIFLLKRKSSSAATTSSPPLGNRSPI